MLVARSCFRYIVNTPSVKPFRRPSFIRGKENSRVLLKSLIYMSVSYSEVSSNSELTGERKRKMAPKIGTHNGTFHADEALGCYLLKLTEKFSGAELVRTRKEEVLRDLDVVLDVGSVYDSEKLRFDHHQRNFAESFGHGFKTKLSSAGLVYKHFGKEVVAKIMGLPENHKDVQKIYLTVYKNFMECIDAVDNGVNQCVSDLPPLYVNNTHVSARVGRLNSDWTEESSEEKENIQFHAAMELIGGEFVECVKYYAKSWLPARSIVEETLLERKLVHESGEILKLKSFCPWKEHLSELESEHSVDPLPKYILYEDDRANSWRVQAIAESPGSFNSRKPLPSAWRGFRDEELSKLSGIPGCVFVHASGFIGGNATYDGALAMAVQALSLE